MIDVQGYGAAKGERRQGGEQGGGIRPPGIGDSYPETPDEPSLRKEVEENGLDSAMRTGHD